MTRIVAIADSHCQHRSITLPPCDILIHAGDATYRGTEGEISDFLSWFSTQDAKHKIFVPGNHDYLPQKNPSLFRSLVPDSVRVLIDARIELEGLIFYGTPWTPFFYDWAYNSLEERGGQGYNYEGGPGWNPKSDKDHPYSKDMFDQISDDVNILICHGPPRLGNLDRCLPMGNPVGSEELMKKCTQLKQLKVFISGHIHEGHGYDIFNGVTYYNVSTCNRDYKPVNAPVVMDL